MFYSVLFCILEQFLAPKEFLRWLICILWSKRGNRLEISATALITQPWYIFRDEVIHAAPAIVRLVLKFNQSSVSEDIKPGQYGRPCQYTIGTRVAVATRGVCRIVPLARAHSSWRVEYPLLSVTSL